MFAHCRLLQCLFYGLMQYLRHFSDADGLVLIVDAKGDGHAVTCRQIARLTAQKAGCGVSAYGAPGPDLDDFRGLAQYLSDGTLGHHPPVTRLGREPGFIITIGT